MLMVCPLVLCITAINLLLSNGEWILMNAIQAWKILLAPVAIGMAQWRSRKTRVAFWYPLLSPQIFGECEGIQLCTSLSQDFHLTIKQLCILGSPVSWAFFLDPIGFTP
jgi:hypothetical protein